MCVLGLLILTTGSPVDLLRDQVISNRVHDLGRRAWRASNSCSQSPYRLPSVKLDRKSRQGAYPQPFSPYQLGWVYREPDIGKSSQQALKCDRRLSPRKLETKAEVHARSEGKMWIWLPGDIELMSIVELSWVAIGGREEGCNAFAAPQLMTGEPISRDAQRGFVSWTGDT